MKVVFKGDGAALWGHLSTTTSTLTSGLRCRGTRPSARSCRPRAPRTAVRPPTPSSSPSTMTSTLPAVGLPPSESDSGDSPELLPPLPQLPPGSGTPPPTPTDKPCWVRIRMRTQHPQPRGDGEMGVESVGK
ncbi:hypothetical protein EYF80_028669 [Liparis tanakae]|uniref:Uncharacterized protein n=1 Tax=Liparis tanakae TaxID=230148 RepID=A0A4Z2H675_9TELE|nr:hypothetical protein EYF80_028669 [Liparis tanakae]